MQFSFSTRSLHRIAFTVGIWPLDAFGLDLAQAPLDNFSQCFNSIYFGFLNGQGLQYPRHYLLGARPRIHLEGMETLQHLIVYHRSRSQENYRY
jgi:hypothetical protein